MLWGSLSCAPPGTSFSTGYNTFKMKGCSLLSTRLSLELKASHYLPIHFIQPSHLLSLSRVSLEISSPPPPQAFGPSAVYHPFCRVHFDLWPISHAASKASLSVQRLCYILSGVASTPLLPPGKYHNSRAFTALVPMWFYTPSQQCLEEQLVNQRTLTVRGLEWIK